MKLLFMFLFTIGSSNSDIVWNEVVDQGIVTTTEELIERHADSISIPDIEETFKETILGIIPFTINLRINGALFWNLTTVKRKGNVKVVQDNKTKNITFLLPLGLNDLHLKVKDFFINFFGLTIFGLVHVECASNELQFSISLYEDSNGDCKSDLNWVRITDFSKFTIHIVPSRFFNWIAKHTASLILNYFPTRIINILNQHLEEGLKEALTKVDVCNNIPFVASFLSVLFKDTH